MRSGALDSQLITLEPSNIIVIIIVTIMQSDIFIRTKLEEAKRRFFRQGSFGVLLSLWSYSRVEGHWIGAFSCWDSFTIIEILRDVSCCLFWVIREPSQTGEGLDVLQTLLRSNRWCSQVRDVWCMVAPPHRRHILPSLVQAGRRHGHT